MAAVQNIAEADGFYVGEDKVLVFDITDSSGSPQTMTGWTLSWSLRRTQGASGTAISTLTTTAGDITIGDADGTDDRATVTVGSAETSGLAPGVYAYSLARTDSGSWQVLAAGSCVLLASTERA